MIPRNRGAFEVTQYHRKNRRVKSSTNHEDNHFGDEHAFQHKIRSGTKQDPHLTQFDISAGLIEALLVLCLLRLAPAGQHGLLWRKVRTLCGLVLVLQATKSLESYGIIWNHIHFLTPPYPAPVSPPSCPARLLAGSTPCQPSYVHSPRGKTSFVGKDWSTQSTGIPSQDISSQPTFPVPTPPVRPYDSLVGFLCKSAVLSQLRSDKLIQVVEGLKHDPVKEAHPLQENRFLHFEELQEQGSC